MCGISDIINFNNIHVEEQPIRKMMQVMKHRGPDDEGVFIDNNVGLGFVRLSILDLSNAGHQPMFSHNKRYVIIHNGEVYNYIELRNELKTKYRLPVTIGKVVNKLFPNKFKNAGDKGNDIESFVDAVKIGRAHV